MTPVWAWLRWLVAAILLLLMVALVYWAVRDVRQPFRVITPGAVLVISAWVAASVAFGYYVQNFASYAQDLWQHGRRHRAALALLPFRFSHAIRAEVNAVLARERGERIEEAEK